MGRKLVRLPGILADIEKVAGREAALAIASAHGGQKKLLPTGTSLKKSPHRYRDNWLVLAVGYETALIIAQELSGPGGYPVDIPKGEIALKHQFILENAATLSVSELASCLDLTERSVRRIKSRLHCDPQ